MVTRHRPSPALQRRLEDLLAQAMAQPGSTASIRLSNNLLVSAEVISRQIRLSISRSSTWPNERDWRIIQRHWPTQLPGEPHRIREGERYCLVIIESIEN